MTARRLTRRPSLAAANLSARTARTLASARPAPLDLRGIGDRPVRPRGYQRCLGQPGRFSASAASATRSAGQAPERGPDLEQLRPKLLIDRD